MTRRFLSAVAGLVVAASVPTTSFADVDVAPGPSSIDVLLDAEFTAQENGAAPFEQTNSDTAVTYVAVPSCEVDGQHLCRSDQVCPDGQPLMTLYAVRDGGSRKFVRTYCPSESRPAPAALTDEMVLRALRRIDLPVPQLTVQPPGGKTLVNLETILSTEAEAFTRTLTLAGQRVTVELTPSSYQWEHGDGTTQQTDGPGQPYRRGLPMDRYVTHTYTSADVTVQARVTTTWSARFRTPDQPWQSVDGTVSMTSPPTPLRVVEATPLLAKVR